MRLFRRGDRRVAPPPPAGRDSREPPAAPSRVPEPHPAAPPRVPESPRAVQQQHQQQHQQHGRQCPEQPAQPPRRTATAGRARQPDGRRQDPEGLACNGGRGSVSPGRGGAGRGAAGKGWGARGAPAVTVLREVGQEGRGQPPRAARLGPRLRQHHLDLCVAPRARGLAGLGPARHLRHGHSQALVLGLERKTELARELGPSATVGTGSNGREWTRH